MKKTLLFLLLLGVASLGYYCFFNDYDHSNDTLYFGGEIITMKDSAEVVDAVYVKDGKIIATGSKSDLLKLVSNKTQMHDLQGKTLMPGFFDPHGHFDFATIFADMVDISGVDHRDPKEVWEIVESECRKGKENEWIYFYGMDPQLTLDIKTPSIQYLDSIAPNKPIIIITKALHVFYANSKTFEALGITDKTPDPSKASYYERDANGKLSGGIVEQAALEPIRKKIEEMVKIKFVKNTQTVMQNYAKMGVTSVVNIGLSTKNDNILTLYKHIASEKAQVLSNALQLIGKLPKRKPNPRIFIYLRKENDEYLPENVTNGDDFFKFLGVKFWYDGSPYSGSMFLRKPYMQSSFTINDIHLGPEHTSEPLIKQADLEALIEKYQSKGWQVAIHAQGDIANEEVIEAFQNVNKKLPIADYRHRLEHCMLLPKEKMVDIKSLNITPSFHINHLLYNGQFLKKEIIGEDRGEKIFPIQSAASYGIKYSLHADMPQFYPNPLSLMSTSVNRLTESGTLISPNQRVSIWQALKSMTTDAAWQMHMEDKLGSIEKGKYADFVILDKNPLKIAPQDLSKIKVLETIVAGNQIWNNNI